MYNRDRFDKHFERTERTITFVFWLIVALVLAALIGGGFVIYRVLAFFGIL